MKFLFDCTKNQLFRIMNSEREVLGEDIEISTKPALRDPRTDYMIETTPTIPIYSERAFPSEMTIQERMERAIQELQALGKISK